MQRQTCGNCQHYDQTQAEREHEFGMCLLASAAMNLDPNTDLYQFNIAETPGCHWWEAKDDVRTPR